jgi:hypothetical protein
MKIIDSTLQFARREPLAYSLLPEPYRADDCLRFSIHSGIITAEPKPGQQSALGYWKAIFSDTERRWIPIL